MELVTILATVILLATLITLFFSFAAYFITRAKKLRSGGGNRQTGESAEGEGDGAPLTPAQRGRELFERYTPGQSETKWQAPTSAASNEQTEEDDQWM